VVGRKQHLLSGIARCGKCGGPLYPYGARGGKSATYRCVTGPAGKGCGGISVNAEILDEYVTGAVLDALESPRVQQAVQAGEDTSAPRRAELLEEIRRPRTSGPKRGGTGQKTPSTRLTGSTSSSAPKRASPQHASNTTS
jgi:hypothetical protein